MPRESIRILPYFAIPKKGKKEKKKEEIEEAKCETAEPEEYENGREREREERGTNFCDIGRMGEDDEGEGEGRSEDCRGIDRPPRHDILPLRSSLFV